MRSTLIFKNIPGIQNESWEKNSRLLADFITCELDLPYSFEKINFQISRAHRSTEQDKDHSNKNQRSPKPIFAQFVNWCIAEEIRNRIIELNTKRRINVFVSQVYSKQLTLQRNGVLKYRRDILTKIQTCRSSSNFQPSSDTEGSAPAVSGTHSRFFKF